MDIEKIKKVYKWDPSKGDYSKSYVHYEKKRNRKKRMRSVLFKIVYLLILTGSIIVIYLKFQ